jgi:outer membrane protein OmpA-like peptidoglycan-associated protein
MTKEFRSRIVQVAAAAVLACSLTISAGAQNAPQPDVPATMILFFDSESAQLTPEAKSIVLAAVDAAERGRVRRIELAVHSSAEELARDPELATRRAGAVRRQIADFGYRGQVYVDEEAPEIQLAAVEDATFQHSAILRIGR